MVKPLLIICYGPPSSERSCAVPGAFDMFQLQCFLICSAAKNINWVLQLLIQRKMVFGLKKKGMHYIKSCNVIKQCNRQKSESSIGEQQC